MSNINFPNSQNNNNVIKPEVQRRLESQENFTALDKERLQQDAVELAGKTKEKVKENWIYRTMRNTFGVEDPKKLLKSVAMTVATVAGLAFVGNKLSNPTAGLGLKVDKMLENSKAYGAVSGFFSKIGNNIKGFFMKSKTIQDIAETFKNRKAVQKLDMTRGYGRGFVSIFSLTPPDTLEKAFSGMDVRTVTKQLKKKGLTDGALQSALTAAMDKNVDEVETALKGLVGDKPAAKELAQQILGMKSKDDNRAFCESLSNAMREYLGCANKGANGKFLSADNEKFFAELKNLQKGTFNGHKVDTRFIDVNMKGGGLIGSWWPVNIIDSIGKKFNPDFKFCRGNLGDSLVKFNAVNGSLASTKAGSLVQKMTTVPTESISNFVNDKSGMGVLLCASIVSLYNNVQDAPKDKKIATIADDYIGTIGSIAIATPMAFGATYGLATLANTEGKTIFSKMLKPIGKFFGMGLDKYTKDAAGNMVKQTVNKTWKNFIPRFAGGALRFALVMAVFAPLVQKPLRAVIHKIFGKPYNEAEEKQKQALEQQKNAVIPELGITQQQLVEKIQNNPDKVQALDNNPALVQKLQEHPELLADYLDGKDILNPEVKKDETNKTQQADNSENTLGTQNTQAEVQKFQQNKLQQQPAQQTNSDETGDIKNAGKIKVDASKPHKYDTATYIPSSDVVAKAAYYTPEQSDKINALMQDADAALKRAEKFL